MSDAEIAWEDFLDALAAPESPASQRKTKAVFMAGFSRAAAMYGSLGNAESALMKFEQSVRDCERICGEVV